MAATSMAGKAALSRANRFWLIQPLDLLGSSRGKRRMIMPDPFMTSLSLGWALMAAGVLSTLVIATGKPLIQLVCRLKQRSIASKND
jgi:hypothetical protein